MTTWNDARVAVLRDVQANHDQPLAVAPWGWDTGDAYHLVVDTPEAVVDPDVLGLLDPPMYRVPKATGVAERETWPESLEARQEGRPVGANPPD